MLPPPLGGSARQTGQYDGARPETVEYYHGLVNGSKFEVLPDAGHAVYLDQTELFNNSLVDFFGEVESLP